MENNKSTETTKTPVKVKVVKPATFMNCADVTFSTSAEVAAAINGMFEAVFDDYSGCNIVANAVQGRGIVVTPILYFSVRPEAEYADESKTFAFAPIIKNPGDDIVQRRMKVLTGSSMINTKVNITEDGNSALADFVLGDFTNEKKIPWTSDYYNVFSNNMETYIAVSKLDIVKLISKIYGEVDANGNKIFYQTTAVGPAANSYGRMENWIFYILRVHEEIYDKLKLKGWNINPANASPIMYPVR